MIFLLVRAKNINMSAHGESLAEPSYARWTLLDELCMVSALAMIGFENWRSVSRLLERLPLNKPRRWFTPKNCAKHYDDLLETMNIIRINNESELHNLKERLKDLWNYELKTFSEEDLHEDDADICRLRRITLAEIDKMLDELHKQDLKKEEEVLRNINWIKERRNLNMETDDITCPKKCKRDIYDSTSGEMQHGLVSKRNWDTLDQINNFSTFKNMFDKPLSLNLKTGRIGTTFLSNSFSFYSNTKEHLLTSKKETGPACSKQFNTIVNELEKLVESREEIKRAKMECDEKLYHINNSLLKEALDIKMLANLDVPKVTKAKNKEIQILQNIVIRSAFKQNGVKQNQNFQAVQTVQTLQKNVPNGNGTTLKKLLYNKEYDTNKHNKHKKNILKLVIHFPNKGVTKNLEIETDLLSYVIDQLFTKNGFVGTYSLNNKMIMSNTIAKNPKVLVPKVVLSKLPSQTSSPYLDTYKRWKRTIILIYRNIAYHIYASIFTSLYQHDAHYHRVIKRPMDLRRIHRNIQNGVIHTTARFKRDVLLMFNNVLMYHKNEDRLRKEMLVLQMNALQQINYLLDVERDNNAVVNAHTSRTRRCSRRNKARLPRYT